jgi:hypothetical protein
MCIQCGSCTHQPTRTIDDAADEMEDKHIKEQQWLAEI